MKDGQHEALPLAEFVALREDLELQARAEGVALRIATTERADGSVDVAWFVLPKTGIAAVESLGELSRRFEVGARGTATISTGLGDRGGKSYGSWQMTSKPAGGTVTRFVSEAGFAFAADFAGQVAGSAGFDAAWKAVAARDAKGFEAAQHGFILRTHYDPALRRLKEKGIDVAARSRALQDVLWSTAVQHGPDGAVAIFMSGAGATDDAALIRAVYAERGRSEGGVLLRFAGNSPAVQASVAKRFVQEQADALALLAAEAARPKPAVFIAPAPGPGAPAGIPAPAAPAGGAAPGLPAWFVIARGEMAQAAVAGAGNNPRIQEYFSWTSLGEQPDSVAWCGAFLAFCIGKAGFLRKGSGSARAADWLRFGEALAAPRPGCIVVLAPQAAGASGHVGFFEAIEGSRIKLLGGNQGGRVGVDGFALKDVRQAGYRWPSGA